MEQIYVQEARSEILICLDRHMSDRLSALEEAAKALQREVLHERANPSRNANWESRGNEL